MSKPERGEARGLPNAAAAERALRDRREVKVVCFSGGRGSTLLSSQLIANPRVDLTVAINGYDDGKSTGEVRRFFGDALGPSDYRKNASNLARGLTSCSEALIELLDLRLPLESHPAQAVETLSLESSDDSEPGSFAEGYFRLLRSLAASERKELRARLRLFLTALAGSSSSFSLSDCSVGNLVFAGSYLKEERRFNAAVADYCSLLGLAPGLIENVTDGADAHLLAITTEGRLLASEAAIVDAERHQIEDIFLVDRPLRQDEIERTQSREQALELVAARAIEVEANPELIEKIGQADIIIYAPGTQHSSLFPSYMTPGIGSAIARNLKAVKVLVTNIREDTELKDTSAVDITSKALYYLRERGRLSIPAPFLITHYLLNDPATSEEGKPYVPLGRLQSFEDPRLVRIANFEQAASGRHDASKVLAPFIRTYLGRDDPLRVGVLLLETSSLDKVCQTILESSRAGLQDIPVASTFLFASDERLSPEIAARLPFQTVNAHSGGVRPAESLLKAFQNGSYDLAVLFESSGMYRGEDIANLVSLLTTGELDAVWGSRRLSVRDIRHSYHLRYRRHPILGAVSYVGSHLLSVIYLVLYGRYVADVLSGARAVRSEFLLADEVRLDDKTLNQRLLSAILRARGEIFETPIRFFSMSPDKVHRTTWWEGLRSIGTIIGLRLRP